MLLTEILEMYHQRPFKVTIVSLGLWSLNNPKLVILKCRVDSIYSSLVKRGCPTYNWMSNQKIIRSESTFQIVLLWLVCIRHFCFWISWRCFTVYFCVGESTRHEDLWNGYSHINHNCPHHNHHMPLTCHCLVDHIHGFGWVTVEP